MNTRGIFCGLVAAVLLAACASPGPPGRSETCTAAQCELDVSVVGSPPRVRVNIETLTVRGNRNVAIAWNLKSDQYEFKDDSIQFYDPRAAREFSAPTAGEKGAQVRLTNRNSEKGEWGYQIKVYEKATGKWIPLDPAIFNDGG